jgi:hypothetical protein
MALDPAVKLSRRRRFRAKLETTTGTAISLDAASGKIIVRDPSITYPRTGNDRQAQGALAMAQHVPGPKEAQVSVVAELMGNNGSGTNVLFDMLKCCGLKASGGTLSPLTNTDSASTMTVGTNHAGRYKQAAGVMFDCTIRGEYGQIVLCEFTGRGKWATAVADEAIWTDTLPSHDPPILVGATLTIATVSYTVPGFELRLGNDVQLRQDITDATGIRAAHITSHNRRLLISPEALPLSTKDWYGLYTAKTEVALNLVVDGGSNNTVTITAGKMQLAQPPNEEDDNGLIRDALEFQLNANTLGSDDELSIAFS